MKWSLFSLLLLPFTNLGLTNGDRPHVIVIVIDDLGWNDISLHGAGQIPTPNLDALAADGLLLDNYYTLPLCTPSRSALLSGYYPIHTGLQHDVIYASMPYGQPLNLTLLPEHLQRLGYASHALGKWHLGFYRKEFTPTFRGFDSHYGSWLGHGSYYDHTGQQGNAYGLDLRDGLEPDWTKEGKYTTDLLTEKAVNIIHNHNGSQPLFLYLSHMAVHVGLEDSPLQATPKYMARFPHIDDVRRKIFAGMVAGFDDSLGYVMRALSESRMLNNSVILVTNDNGGAAGGMEKSASSNWPLRGSKGTLWEGGVRGTAVLWSPLLKGRPGRVNEGLMHIADWMPTLYSAAGGDSSDLGVVDGLDMWPALNGALDWPREEVLLNIDPVWKMAALIKGKYKLIDGHYPGLFDSWYGPSGRDSASMSVFQTLPQLANSSMVAQTLRNAGRPYVTPSLEWYKRRNLTCPSIPPNSNSSYCQNPQEAPCLFDLETDPCETTDISKEFPEVFSELMSILGRYNKTSVPIINKPNDPLANPKYHDFLWTHWMDESTAVC